MTSVTNIINDIQKACIKIATLMNKHDPTELGQLIGIDNHSGDHIKKLDALAHQTILHYLDRNEYVSAIISEEHEQIYQTGIQGGYLVAYDPIDGSSNIELNITTGTIFGIYLLNSDGKIESPRQIVAAGYCLYGAITEFVYTTSEMNGIRFLNLSLIEGCDPIETKINWKIPKYIKMYSINQAYYHEWISNDVRNKVVEWMNDGYTLRYVGSMVADAHRTLVKGGYFLYPRTRANPEGKIRCFYEAYPFAFMFEKAGGSAKTDKFDNILDSKVGSDPHQTISVILSA
uniref:fructose-bisphosphatase n=1 Tax=viral metagenome TaxID=1070528 RepID=A0A6C0E7R3_9ZZZZ